MVTAGERLRLVNQELTDMYRVSSLSLHGYALPMPSLLQGSPFSFRANSSCFPGLQLQLPFAPRNGQRLRHDQVTNMTAKVRTVRIKRARVD